MTDLLSSTVVLDPITTEVAKAFDCPFDGTSSFKPWPRPALPETWGIGVIVGGSGTGKSILLRSLGEIARPEWRRDHSIAAHFASRDEAMLRLSAAGLSSIPDWCKPYHVLSTGQQFRADLARSMATGACIDEFTSTVDREVAKAASVACARYVKNTGIQRLTLATCHRDIVAWLEPDWVFDTDTGEFSCRRLERPRIEAELREGDRALWPRFAPHHYLSADIAPACRTYTLWIGERVVGLCAVMPMPGRIHGAWRGHRTVILPEFQGFGLGGRMVEAVGDILRAQGKRFFCRTAHPWVGRHRDQSPRWRPTSTSQVQRIRWKNRPADKPAWWKLDADRICWSHEYLGDVPVAPATEDGLTHDRRFPPPPAPGAPRKARRPPQMVRVQADAILARLRAGESAKTVAAALGLRRSSIYILQKWDALGRP